MHVSKKSLRRQRLKRLRSARYQAFALWLEQTDFAPLNYRQWCHPHMRERYE